MNKNIFDNLEVFAPEAQKVAPQQPSLTKKQQNSATQALRQSYETSTHKPQPNKMGSKTIKSTKEDRRPHQEVDLNRQAKKQHGANEVLEEMKEQIEEVQEQTVLKSKTVAEYFRDQGVEIQLQNDSLKDAKP